MIVAYTFFQFCVHSIKDVSHAVRCKVRDMYTTFFLGMQF